MRATTRLPFILALLCACACGDDSATNSEGILINDCDDVEVTVAGSAYSVGTLHANMPCTAFVVAPRRAVTAAHCLGFRTGEMRGTLVLAGERYDFDRGHSFTTGTFPASGPVPDDPSRDVGVVRLMRDAPAPYVQLRTAAAGPPSEGATAVVVGAGCRSHMPASSGVLHAATARWSVLAACDLLCGGDSGGPVMVGQTGYGVSSWYEQDEPSEFCWINATMIRGIVFAP